MTHMTHTHDTPVTAVLARTPLPMPWMHACMHACKGMKHVRTCPRTHAMPAFQNTGRAQVIVIAERRLHARPQLRWWLYSAPPHPFPAQPSSVMETMPFKCYYLVPGRL